MKGLTMTIEQGSNGWIIRYNNSSGSERTLVFTTWKDVIKTLNTNYGFYDDNDNITKDPTLTHAYDCLKRNTIP